MFHIFAEYFMQITQICVKKNPQNSLKFHLHFEKYFKINKILILICLIFFLEFSRHFFIFSLNILCKSRKLSFKKIVFFYFHPKILFRSVKE